MHAVSPVNNRRRRIVLTTFGSLGDLHPYIAVALGLQERGHEAIIASSGISAKGRGTGHRLPGRAA